MKLKFLLVVFALLVGCSEKNISSKNQPAIHDARQVIQLKTEVRLADCPKSKTITTDKIEDIYSLNAPRAELT
ncbi:MAG: hypothetical protein LBJ96_01375 [Holosporaceae bacterium]|jgi:hypothetical protein|nr:hypothetical protein [Holosporaceae bacterium]